MDSRTPEALDFVRRELAPLRDQFSAQEERLFREGRYRDMTKRLLERARRRYGTIVGLLVALQFLPVAYVLFALLIFDLGPLAVVLGFVALFLIFGLVPIRLLVDSRRLYRSAARAWVVALEAEEERLPPGVDPVALADRMDHADRHLFENGRIRELAERLEERGRQGVRFSRIFRFVPLAALALVAVRWVAGIRGEGADTLVLAPVGLAFVAILYAVVRTGRESKEKVRIGSQLSWALDEGA